MKRKPKSGSPPTEEESAVVQETPALSLPAMEIGAFDAKTRLSELLQLVVGGQSFIITKRGHPVAELKPCGFAKMKPKRKAGFWPHPIKMGADFDAPLPEFEAYS